MKYIAFYNDENHLYENRYMNPAAATVIEYMMDIFSTYDNVEIISPSRTLNESGIFMGRKTKLSPKIVLKVPFSIGVKSKVGKVLVKSYTQLWLLWELFFNTHKNEIVVFYHSLFTMHIAEILMKIKKVNVVLEYREIYSDINHVKKRIKNKEKSYWKEAKAMILPSKSFEKILGIENKICLYAPGTYKVNGHNTKTFSDNKIHIVYAGNLRPEKGGAFLAIECSQYLSSDYIIHILGKGSEEELLLLREKIESVKEPGKAEVKYEGFKTNKELTDFIARCHIGLAVQKSGDFNNSSFPSKILLYLTSGVKVIAPKIDTVMMSPIAKMVEFYDGDTAEDIVQSISNINMQDIKQIHQELQSLDIGLKNEWKNLISKE